MRGHADTKEERSHVDTRKDMWTQEEIEDDLTLPRLTAPSRQMDTQGESELPEGSLWSTATMSLPVAPRRALPWHP